MKLFIALVLLFIGLTGMSQTEDGSNVYKIHHIHATDDYYLIFLRKNNKKFTIYSKKEIIKLEGEKLIEGNSYYFELVPVKDTLPNGKSMKPINYAHIIYFGFFTGAEIGELCTAKNLVGIIIPKKAQYYPRH